MTSQTALSDATTVPAPTHEPQPPCPMPQIAKLIGGKWKLIILQTLIFHGAKRFNELRRIMSGITQTVLTSQLRALEEDGLVSRKVYAEAPPRVEYAATELAMDLQDMFLAMHAWWVKQQEGDEASSPVGGAPQSNSGHDAVKT